LRADGLLSIEVLLSKNPLRDINQDLHILTTISSNILFPV
jgi:hypothetical protein